MATPPAATKGLPAVSSSSYAEDLWMKAVEELSDENKKDIDFTRTDKRAILDDVLAAVEKGKQICIQKRWKYRKGDREIIIRDKLEKVVTWVNTFKGVCNTVVQYDPGHAALPWAGVKFLLQIAINDSQIYGAMVDGVEQVSNMVGRYAILEAFYLLTWSTKPAAHGHLEGAIIKLYAAILTYLAGAKRYYDKNTAQRVAGAILHTAESSVDSYLTKIRRAQVDVDACIRLIDAEKNQNMNHGVRELQEGFQKLTIDSHDVAVIVNKLGAILSQLDNPITRHATLLSGLHDSLDEAKRQELSRWLSTVPCNAHHKEMGVGFLPYSGRWLIQKKEFVEWRKSSVSSVLWLRGIPGSGKTRLVYSVIEHLLQEALGTKSPAPIAFFYCARAEGEPERADPDEIMRCILKQLSCHTADLPIREPVATAFREKRRVALSNGYELAQLSLAECEEMIISLLDDNPATIIIDALDECNSKRRYEIFRTLDNIIQKSPSLVKVFISSREDRDIVCRLEGSPNITINASDNGKDIENSVITEVNKAVKDKRLLGGVISNELRMKIVKSLINGAQGMFRWVSLQIDNLCDSDRMNHEEDLEQELGQLPITLKESYRIIHERIKSSGATSRIIADKVISWLLCARRALRSQELIAAVSVNSDGRSYEISSRDLLNMCCNLVILDKQIDVFRFAHLSVQEYFQTQGEYGRIKINELVVTRCVNVFIAEAESEHHSDYTIQQNKRLKEYATLYWTVHCSKTRAPKCRGRVKRFLFRGPEVAPAFKNWMSAFGKTVEDRSRYERIKCTPITPLLLACVVGWLDLLDHLRSVKNINWNQGNDAGTTTTLRLALRYGNIGAAQWLLAAGADVNAVGQHGEQILLGAISAKEYTGVKFLLAKGAHVNGVDELDHRALHRAASSGNLDILRLVLAAGSNIDAADSSGYTALHIAVMARYASIVEALIAAKANVHAVDNSGMKASSIAANNGSLGILRMLVTAEEKSSLKEIAVNRGL